MSSKMVKQTDNMKSLTARHAVSKCRSRKHNSLFHRVNVIEDFLSGIYRTYDNILLENTKYSCCNEGVSPQEWPRYARLISYVPPSPSSLGKQSSETSRVSASSPSPSTSTSSASSTSNQNGEALVQEDAVEVDPEEGMQVPEGITPAPQQPPVVEIVVETAPEVVPRPRPCSVIRHVSSDSLASLVAPPESSPVISPCSSPSASPDPSPTSAATDNDKSVDEPLLTPATQPTSDANSSLLNQDQPSLPEDDNQSMNSTDTEIAPENHAAINDVDENDDASSNPESNLVDRVTEIEPVSAKESPAGTSRIEEVTSELENSDANMPNTSAPSKASAKRTTTLNIQSNGQISLKRAEQQVAEFIDLTSDGEITPPGSHANDKKVTTPESEQCANSNNGKVTTPETEPHANNGEVTTPETEPHANANNEEVTTAPEKEPHANANNEEVTTTPEKEPHANANNEIVTTPESHADDANNGEVTTPEPHADANNGEVTTPEPHADANNGEVTTPEPHCNSNNEEATIQETHDNSDKVVPPESHTSDEDDEVTILESDNEDSRKIKLPGCTSAIRLLPIKPNEPNKHWKKSIATPFIKGNSTLVSNLSKICASTATMNGDPTGSGSSSKYITRIDPKTNKKMRVPVCLASGTQIGAPPPKKRPHTLVLDFLPSPPPPRRNRRPTLLPPKRKRDDSSDASSVGSTEDIDQDEDEDTENGINPALYPDVELRENQSQDNQPPAVSEKDDCVVLDDDSQQPGEIQLPLAPVLNDQSNPPPLAQSSSAVVSSIVVSSGPPSVVSEKSDASSGETIVDRAFSDVSNLSSGEGHEGEDPDIIIIDYEDDPPSTSTAAIIPSQSNSVQMNPNTAEHNQRDTVRASENQNGALAHPPSLQQPINKDHSKFHEYRRHILMGSSGKNADDNISQKLNESSLSCDDEDTDNGSQKDQDPQMPVLRLPIPVSPLVENGNANIEAPALILHPGDRAPSLNENGEGRMDAFAERILNAEEDRDIGGIGGDEKSDDEAERTQIVQRKSRRKRKKHSKYNDFTDDEYQSMSGFAEMDDEVSRNVVDQDMDVGATAEEEHGKESRSDRETRTSRDQRWFRSEHKNFAKLTIRSGKMQEPSDWRPAKQDDYPFTQEVKKRGRGRPRKIRRADTDIEGGSGRGRGSTLRRSSSRPSAATDFGYSSNDDEPLINKKVRTQNLHAKGPRSGDNNDGTSNEILRNAENDIIERFPNNQPIAGPSQRFYHTAPLQPVSNGTSEFNYPVYHIPDNGEGGYIEDSWTDWPQSGQHGDGLRCNPADTSIYTERLSGVEDPDATAVVDFTSELGSQGSTTTTAASLASTPGRKRRLKRGIIVQCDRCHRQVSNHFLNRHQRSNNCDRNRPPRPAGGAMTDYDNDSQTEAEFDDEEQDRNQQPTRKRGRPRGSKMGKCTFCLKNMLQSTLRNHVLNRVCPESRAAVERGAVIDYYSQDDSQTEDEGWDHNDNGYGNSNGVANTVAVAASATSISPAARINCHLCGINMLKTSLRNHLNQKRCRGLSDSASSSAAAAAGTISTNSPTNPNHSTNQYDEMVVEGSGTGDGGGESQGYLTNKKPARSCRRVTKYVCDDDDDDESFFESEKSAGYDRVVSSPPTPEQQKIFDVCPYEDCSFGAANEKEYLEHTTEEHPLGEGFPCNICNLVYIQRLNLEDHQKTHVLRFPFDATMVSYKRNPRLQPTVVISENDFLAARQALQH